MDNDKLVAKHCDFCNNKVEIESYIFTDESVIKGTVYYTEAKLVKLDELTNKIVYIPTYTCHKCENEFDKQNKSRNRYACGIPFTK